MDWISITTGCYAASNAISRTSQTVHDLIREVRELRADLDVVSGELHSLGGVLDLLKDDAGAFPGELASATPGVLEKCTTILNELEGCVRVINGAGISRMDKKFRWIACRTQISRLRFTLEAYKATLGLALDLLAITSPQSASSSDTDLPGQVSHREPDRDREISRVLVEMGYLKARLEEDFQDNGMASNIQSYVDILQVHAEDAGLDPVGNSLLVVRRNGSVDNTSAPDSAIEMNDESPAQSPRAAKSPASATFRVDERDEFLDELREMPSRPPTPPPKAARRLSMASRRSSMISAGDRTPSLAPSIYSASSPAPSLMKATSSAASSIPASPTTPTSLQSPLSPSNPTSQPPSPTSIPKSPPIPPRRSSTPGFAPSIVTEHSIYTTVTKISAGSDAQSLSPPGPRSSSRMGWFLGHMRGASSSDKAKDAPAATEERPSTAMSFHAPVDLVRRGSKCISANINKLGSAGAHTFDAAGSVLHHSWRPQVGSTLKAEPDGEPHSVFGVSLKQSMAVAKASAMTHHAGSSGGSSRREFPLCVMKCCSFLRQAGGLAAPHIFGEAGDPAAVRDLQRIFSTGPAYGRDANLADFGVHEAAALVVLFLAHLPKPLVSAPVAGRWISLSKQATLPGAHAVRLEQCIDFWEEALGGMRGNARALLKLLLNLWGDVADAAAANGMSAEQLAGRLVRPLMHLDGRHGDTTTDYMLGLAFLIRKRSEYSMILRGEGRESRAAF